MRLMRGATRTVSLCVHVGGSLAPLRVRDAIAARHATSPRPPRNCSSRITPHVHSRQL